MMNKVKPHEFFRLDFDQIVDEGKRQEELLTANVGEHALVKNMHDFYSDNMLPLIVSDDWVYDSAYRFATEYGLESIRMIRLTGAELIFKCYLQCLQVYVKQTRCIECCG